MPFENAFPYADLHNLNLDWLLAKVKQMDSINLPAEIQTVFQQMYDNGDLAGILAQLNKMGVLFDTVADMKAATLEAGALAFTLGYYAPGSGGAMYRIVDIHTGFHEVLDNGLFAVPDYEEPVHIKQLGAYGDDTHDDAAVFQAAMSNFRRIYVDPGIYLIGSTLSITDQVDICGAGQDASCSLHFTGAGFLFEVGTDYTNQASIRCLDLTSTDSNSCVKVYTGSWGASVRMEHIRIRGFHTKVIQLMSAYFCQFIDVQVNSRGYTLLTTKDGTSTSTNFTNCVTFERCRFNHYLPGETVTKLFEFFNTRQINFNECQLENAALVLDVTDTSRITYFLSCWFENNTALFKIPSNLAINRPVFNDCHMVNVSTYNYSPDTVDWYEAAKVAYMRSAAGRTYAELAAGVEMVFDQLQTYNGADDIRNYYSLYKFSSQEFLLNRPVNSRYKEVSSSSTTLDLRDILGYCSINAMFTVYVTFQYGNDSSSAYNVHKMNVISHYGQFFAESAAAAVHTGSSGHTETVSVSGTGTVSVSTDGSPTKILVHAVYNMLQ